MTNWDEGGWIRRITWGHTKGPPKITIYDNAGVFAILEGAQAIAFNRVILHAFRAAEEVQMQIEGINEAEKAQSGE